MASSAADPLSSSTAARARDTDTNNDNGHRPDPSGMPQGDEMDAESQKFLNEHAGEAGINARIEQDVADAAKPRAAAESKPSDKPPEAVQEDGISMDFDREPEPIPTHGSTGALFPGVDCTTVAILSARGGGYRYINQYGPSQCPWFVIADAASNLPSDKTVGDLINSDAFQCITDPNSRILDFPYKQTQKGDKLRKENIKGILYVVADVAPDVQATPLEMIKSLDPTEVKGAGVLNDLKSQRQAVKRNDTGIRRYPPTYLLLEFDQVVHEKSNFHKNRSWELSSKFRALYGR